MLHKTYFRSLATAIVFILVITVSATMSAASADGDDDAAMSVEKSEQRYPNLGSLLNQIVSNVEEGRMSASHAAGGAALFSDESVAVTIYLSGHVDEVVTFLEEFGGDPRNVGDDYIEAYVPVSLLGSLSQQTGVLRVRQIIPPQATQLSQRVVGDGPALHGTQAWNAAGYSGQGVKVGVIDLSFRGVTTLLGTDLPATIVARCYEDVGLFTYNLNDCEPSGEAPNPPRGCPPVTPSPGGHGTIVAESLLDMAPGVTLYIADPYSRGDLLETVEWMASEGVQVINYSVGYVFDGPGDGTSPSSVSPLNTVDRAVESDILWVNSAGNGARDTWFGGYSDTDGDLFLEFGGAIEEVIDLPVYECIGHVVQLRWEDSWLGPRTDLDLHLYNKVTDEIVYSSDDLQSGASGQEPWEAFAFTLPFRTNNYGIKVSHYSGEVPDWIQVAGWTVFPIEPHTLNGSITNPAESANLGLLAVGAAPWYSVDTIERYSSRGPTPDGRTKPEIVAVDCGETALRPYRPDTERGFCGTSQAAPHVSGMAALVRQRFPEYSAQQTATYLKIRSEERGPVPNNTWGYGFAQLPAQDALPSADGAAIIEGIDYCGETISSDGAIPGTWTPACQSSEAGRGFARYYQFTLDQETEVIIDLESDLDTYLYLRSGEARAGGSRYENNDVDRPGGNFDSRIRAALAAGSYTIEATTFSANQRGIFTLTVSGIDEPATAPETGEDCGETISSDGATPGTWTSDCRSSETGRGYARYYSFTLGQASDVTIDLESGLDTYLYLRSGEARAGDFLYENDDVDRPNGDFDSRISETLVAGSYTIEATTFGADQAGSFTLTIIGLDEPATTPGTGDDCGETISSDGATPGTWTSDCRSSETGRGYARFYRFTLDNASDITIDLESDLDTYLYLRSGEARAGGFLYENDDVDRPNGDFDSRINETLDPGSYTIEATTFGADQGGSFTLTIGGLGTVPPAMAPDRDALVAFFNATDGPNWRDSSNWLTDAPIEEWYGVSTDGDGRVTYLLLEGNQLTGAIPTVLGDLVNLEKLDLSGNHLTGAIPTVLGDLVSLARLDLSGNQLTGAMPTGLGNLVNLEELDLSDNQLTRAIPAELGDLANLVGLDLSGNQLTGAIPTVLGDLVNLEKLDLSGNHLTGAIPTVLGDLVSLARLDLSGNQLTGAMPTGLGNLVNLEELDLSDNQLTRAIPAELGDLANLVGLDLSGNQLTGAIPTELGDLANLHKITLAGNRFNGCIPEGLRDVPDNDFGLLGLPFCGPNTSGNSFALMATGGSGEATLNWADQAGIDTWQVRWRAEDEYYLSAWTSSSPVTIVDTDGTDPTATITSLFNSVRYCFQVRSLQGNTPGPPSNEACAITAAAPEQADDLTVAAGIRQVTLTWDNPNDDSITVWQYRYSTAGSFTAADVWKDIPLSSAGTVAYTVENLDSGKEYTFEVRALAYDTPGLAAVPETTGSNVVTLEPGPPMGLGADSGDEQVTLSWSDPDDDGIYQWQYRYKVGSGEFVEWTDVFVAGAGENPTDAATRAATAAATGVVVANLTNDAEYSFEVRAVATEDPGGVAVDAAANTVTGPAEADVPGPAASVTHLLEAPTAATAVEGGIPNQTIGLGERRVLDLSVFFVDGQGAGAIDSYQGKVSPDGGPLFAQFSSEGILTMIGLSEGVAAVEVTAIDGYDSDGNGDAADDDPSLLFIVTVRGNS
jgi:hypothetical protein